MRVQDVQSRYTSSNGRVDRSAGRRANGRRGRQRFVCVSGVLSRMRNEQIPVSSGETELCPPLPFKKPGAYGCIPANSVSVVRTTWMLVAKVVTLTVIVARYINLATDIEGDTAWATYLLFVPLSSFMSVTYVSSEFATKSACACQ